MLEPSQLVQAFVHQAYWVDYSLLPGGSKTRKQLPRQIPECITIWLLHFFAPRNFHEIWSNLQNVALSSCRAEGLGSGLEVSGLSGFRGNFGNSFEFCYGYGSIWLFNCSTLMYNFCIGANRRVSGTIHCARGPRSKLSWCIAPGNFWLSWWLKRF